MVGGLVGGPPPFNPGPGHFQRQQPPPQHHHQQQQQHWNAGGPPPPPPPQQIPMGAGRGPGPTPIAGARTPQQDARLRQALDVKFGINLLLKSTLNLFKYKL